MFFALSKIFYWLIMPTGLIAWVILSSFVIKNKKYKSIVRKAGIGLFLILTNPLLAKWAINTWEPSPISYGSLSKDYNCAIVLSGITNPDRPPFDRIQFNKGADRIVHAVDLYTMGVVKKILISGGSGALTFEGKKESHKLLDFAIQHGVSRRDIIVEDQSRNTHENATFVKKTLSDRGINFNTTLLVTSAFHMSRAHSCFKKEGIHATPFPTDYYGGPIRWTPDDIIIPSIRGLQIWTILTKEWLGILAYKIAGYI